MAIIWGSCLPLQLKFWEAVAPCSYTNASWPEIALKMLYTLQLLGECKYLSLFQAVKLPMLHLLPCNPVLFADGLPLQDLEALDWYEMAASILQ